MGVKTRYFGFALVLLFSNQDLSRDAITAKGDSAMNMKVSSTAFNEGETIPKKFTCDGDNISPPLEWSGIPGGTKSIALIADDPDAPRGTWVHWVLFNLPADTKGLSENVPRHSTLKNGARQGMNDSRQLGYDGPCPPGGTHRYFFKVYALDANVPLETGATKAQLQKAMEHHILGEGQLMGTYKR
ncbi:MAG TPA: YbhB/YbcL family Raf kinase inhibitor-like protein [Bacteroidota bacterium]|nr:YbhB/YbcL family Raf kinase inhibitor-like protein [Bacteroidota bacterium]